MAQTNTKKIRNFLILIFILGWFFNRYFLYIDIKNDCYITIKPSITELSSQNIKEAIRILKRTEDDEYNKLCENVREINPNYACGGFGGGCYYSAREQKSDEIHISTARDSHLAWTAAIIAHETCHAIQDKENRTFSEEECYSIGHNVLTNLVRY